MKYKANLGAQEIEYELEYNLCPKVTYDEAYDKLEIFHFLMRGRVTNLNVMRQKGEKKLTQHFPNYFYSREGITFRHVNVLRSVPQNPSLNDFLGCERTYVNMAVRRTDERPLFFLNFMVLVLGFILGAILATGGQKK